MKRIISLFLSAVMLVNCFSFGVSAETVEERVFIPDNANSWRYENGEPIIDQYAVAPIYDASHPDATFTGIDVSHHQGIINWEKVKADGIDFAIIRCGYAEDNPQYDDRYWERNAAECERLGIPYGVYLYSYAESVEDALSEADHVLRLIEGRNLSMPVYWDLEDSRLAMDILEEMSVAFCNKISEAGYPVGIYANLNWWTYYLIEPCCDNWHRWVAQWNDHCDYVEDFAIWQYYNMGTVDGIDGDVDMNYLIGTPDDHKVWTEKLNTPELTITESGAYPVLNWNSIDGAEEYQIWRKTEDNKFALYRTVTETTFTDSSITEETTYYYMIKAVCADKQTGNSYFSEAKSIAYEKSCVDGHTYKGVTCEVCGEKHPDAENYTGKVISVLGDSISTFAGYIPVDDGYNLEHLSRYPQDNLLTDVNETWWMQVISSLEGKLGINDSWRGATMSGAVPVTSGVSGELSAMSNLQRIKNLGSNGTPDVIMLYGGTNDIAHVDDIGTFDAETALQTVDLETLKWDNLADGYVNTVLRLKHFYPDADIIALLPTYTSAYYTDEKLLQANAVIAQICEYYNIKYVDLTECGITTDNLPDGIHPDAAGMDFISEAVIETLLENCTVSEGENTVYTVEHKLTNVKATLGYYKGVSAGASFEEELVAEDEIAVKVFVGGVDVTNECVDENKICIENVTGDIVISAMSGYKLEEHLKQLPDIMCPELNIWQNTEHDEYYFTVSNKWEIHSSGNVYSVTIPVSAGDKIYATSFGEVGANGHDTQDGIRVVFFGDYGVLKNMPPEETYAEFSQNGYITAPEGTVAVSVPMWNNSDENELYILNAGHDRTVVSGVEATCTEQGKADYKCGVCGVEYSETTDALGHSFTQYTFNGDGTKTAKCDRCEETETSEDKVHSGVYGENINWFIDSTDTLHILGTGEMENLAQTDIPWSEYKSTIRKAVIENTITTIGDYMFSGCSALSEIIISENVTAVGVNAFAGCTSLETLTIPGSVTTIGTGAFDNNAGTKFIVNKETAAHKWLAENGFTDIDIRVTLEEIKLPETINCTVGTPTELWAEVLPSDTTDTVNFVWTIEDEDIVTYDAETGVLTPTGIGITTVTVTDSISGKTASAAVTVKLKSTEKLKAVWDTAVGKAGLQAGESRTMKISCTAFEILGKEMSAKYFDFKSSNEKAVTVDENGVITVVFTGSGNTSANATITATVKGDTSKKLSLAVKAIPKQTEEIEIIAEYDDADIQLINDEESGVQTIIVPRTLVKDGALPINLKAVAKDADGNEVITNVKWTTDASYIAKVAAVKGTTDSATVTVGKNVNGIATITATANDLTKTTAQITVDVRDYTPRLDANTVTLNTYKTLGAQLQLINVYGNTISAVSLDNAEFFTATYDSATDIVYIDANGFVKNGSYKLNLVTETANGTFEIPITVKAANKLPAITIKQTAPFNLFYKDSTATVTFTVKDETISDVVLTDTDTFAAQYNTDGTMQIVYADTVNPLDTYTNGKPDTSATLEIYFEDYAEPVVKTFRVNARETKPTFTPSRTSTKFTVLSTDNTPIQLTDKATKQVIDLDSFNIEVMSASDGFVTVSAQGSELHINPHITDGKFADGRTSHMAKLEIQGENWLKAMPLNHTISVNSAVPTVKAKTSTLALNALFDAAVTTEMVPSLNNCPHPLYWDIQPENPAQAENTDKLVVTADGWHITAAFADTDNIPANGSYKYNVTTYVEADGELALKTTSVTVAVKTTVPKVTLGKTSVKLNSQLEDSTDITTKITAGAELVDIKVENEAKNSLTDTQVNVSFDADSKTVKAVILDSSVAKGTYKYILTPVVKSDAEGSAKYAELKPLTLSVAVYSAAPAITTSAKDAIDLTNRDNGIVYTVTAGKNFNYDVTALDWNSFALAGEDADKFEVEVMQPNAKGQPQVMVKAKAGQQLSTKVTYKYALTVDVDGIAQPISTVVFKVKPKQTTLRFTATGNLNVYQSTKSGKVYLNVTAPADAQIADVQLAAKGTTVPNNALEYTVQQDANGRWLLSYTVKKASKLKVNASYRIAIAITPEGNGTDKAPQTFNVALKVKR